MKMRVYIYLCVYAIVIKTTKQVNTAIYSLSRVEKNAWSFTRYSYRFNQNKPTDHVQQNSFEKTLVEVCSPNIYASFDTFCVQIDQLLAAQWVFTQSVEFRNRQHLPSMRAICRLTVPRIIDQFGCKRCQKKRKDVDYQLLKSF